MQAVPIMIAQQVVQRTLPALERRIDEVTVAKPEVMDFMVSNVQIIDSIGLNWLLSMQTRLDSLGIRMRLIDPSPILADVLLATRLDVRFTIETLAPVNGENGKSATVPAGAGGGGRTHGS